jgi:hypothetical protein
MNTSCSRRRNRILHTPLYYLIKAELVVNVGGIVTNLRAGNPRNRGSIPSRTPKHVAGFFPGSTAAGT